MRCGGLNMAICGIKASPFAERLEHILEDKGQHYAVLVLKAGKYESENIFLLRTSIKCFRVFYGVEYKNFRKGGDAVKYILDLLDRYYDYADFVSSLSGAEYTKFINNHLKYKYPARRKPNENSYINTKF